MAEKATTGDPYVYNTQQWLNNTYGDDSRFNVVTENGKTGWNTIYGLIRALQIQLELPSTGDNFGENTQAAFQLKFPNGIKQQTDDDKTADNIYGIIQGALICKGYDFGASKPTCHFYDGTGNAIKKMKKDAGLADTSSTVTLNVMKALLSMDYFYSYNQSERTKNIIEMQRYLNRNYELYIGIRPCDGVYARRTSQALILAIQAEEGMSPTDANGVCGDNTKRCLPILSANGESSGISYNNQSYTEDSIKRFKILANMALYFNGFGSGELTYNLDENIIKMFQNKYNIAETGKIDRTTWLSLIISCGDKDRSAIACDCATIITNDNVNILVDNNYKYIGRYLSGKIASGASKALSTEELQTLFSNGIRLFPIHQRSADDISYFTTENAYTDAVSAANYARDLHLQFGAIIYFAVDFDATDAQITNTILDYFMHLHSHFITECKGKYRVGVYGTRNLCTRVCNAGYACSSFVSDMSTGFSGNLGFPIPDNWAFDQFNTTTIKSGDKSIEIDKDGFSGRYEGISQEYSVAEGSYDTLNTTSNSFILVNRSGVALSVYEAKTHFNPPLPTTGTHYITTGNKIGEIKPNDFYIFFGVTNPSNDTVHKVLFNDGTDVRMGFIDGQHIYPPMTGTSLEEANYDQKPKYQEPYSCLRYIPETNDYVLNSSTVDQEITINKPVVFFDTHGNYEGTLQKGDKVIISANNVNNTGASRPWCYRTKKIIYKNGVEISSDKYVSVGLEYASSGSERAWY